MTNTAKAIKEQNGNSAIQVEFPYSPDMVAKVKTLEGRRYHSNPKTKFWTAAKTKENIKHLHKWGFTLCPELVATIKGTTITKKQTTPQPLGGILRPFQQMGVDFIEDKEGRALIADEMGLGKTVQALAWLQNHPEHRPALLVVPASLKLNWAQEASVWMNSPKTQILSGTTPGEIDGDIVIINYDILSSWKDKINKHKFKALIFDEVHYVKSNSAQRTKAAKTIAKKIPYLVCLSGTPITNRPVEFYNSIHMINPFLFPSKWKYQMRYCGAKHNGFGWDFSGASNTKELHNILTSTIMLRRLKKDVLKELPDKTYTALKLVIDNKSEYKKAETNFIQYLRETKGINAARKASGAETLASIEALKQLAVTGKLKQSIQWIKDFLESGEKLVVMGVHKFVIDTLMGEFKGVAVKIDGNTPQNQRQLNVEAFQNDPKIRLFVGNIKAAGVGLTLTAASNIMILELPWTPGELQQAIDRVHRIGQKDAVNVYYHIAVGTIEEKIATLIDAKMRVLGDVIDGKEVDSGSLISELLCDFL